MRHAKPVYLPEPPTVAELERQARRLRLLNMLVWLLGIPAMLITILLVCYH